MTIKMEKHGEVTVVSPQGNILQEHVTTFQTAFNDLLEQSESQIVLNLSETQYISSMGLSTITHVKKKLKDGPGDLKIAGVNDLIKKLLETTNLIKKIEVFNTVEAAVMAFE